MKDSQINEFIDALPDHLQLSFIKMRDIIHNHFPQIQETMGYKMPTFKLKKNLIHLNSYPNHIGIYPGPSGIDFLKNKYTHLLLSKGTWQIPKHQDIPLDIFEELIIFIKSTQ
jgi:uncharacterized protein YdhG (YjbR/CyaY superfamily)